MLNSQAFILKSVYKIFKKYTFYLENWKQLVSRFKSTCKL